MDKLEKDNLSLKEKLESSMTQEQVEIFHQKIEKLGGELHDIWRESRKKEDGTFEPRVKATKDNEWINSHGTNQVDIANTSFENLPNDWQVENRASAEVAVSLIYKAKINKKAIDSAFVEEASSVVHDKWLERNSSWAPAEQKVSYSELPEAEKEKDRAIIRKGVDVVKQD